jgi:hypothetical protein
MAAGFERWPALAPLRRRSPAELLRWFHYDTVLFDDAPTRYLLDLVGDDRVLAGSDCPFTMSDHRPWERPGALGLDEGANPPRPRRERGPAVRPIPREPLTTQKGRAGGLLDKRGLGLPNYRSP